MQHRATDMLYFLVLIVSCLSSTSILAHGFSVDTIIKTTSGYEAIQDIIIGSPVISYDVKTGESCPGIVTSKTHYTSATYNLIRLGTTYVITHPQQLFWLVSTNDWVQASNLTPGDSLLTLAGTITIDEISQHSTPNPLTFAILTIADHHTFCITEHEIIVHNFGPEVVVPASAFVLTGLTTCGAPVIVPILTVGTSLVCTGIFIWKFFKEGKERKRRELEYELHLQEATQQEEQKWLKENTNTVFSSQQPQGEKSQSKEDSSDKKSFSGGDGPEDPDKKPKQISTPSEELREKSPCLPINHIKATVNGITKTGSVAEVYKWIKEHQKVIFDAIRPVLNNLVKHAKQIKTENIQIKEILHIFSEKHLKNGLMNVGESVEEVYIKAIQLIAQADAKEMLIPGSNTIRAFINNIPVEVRPYLKENVLLGIDVFVGHSKRIVDNLIIFPKG